MKGEVTADASAGLSGVSVMKMILSTLDCYDRHRLHSSYVQSKYKAIGG